MLYRNPKSGIEIDLSAVDAEKRRFFEAAREKFRQNVSWFEFEQVVFSYTSPIFKNAKSRGDVVSDPVYRALKDMWLQLGIDQGFVAAPTHDSETKTRTSGPHRAARRRHVAASGQPPRTRRRSR